MIFHRIKNKKTLSGILATVLASIIGWLTIDFPQKEESCNGKNFSSVIDEMDKLFKIQGINDYFPIVIDREKPDQIPSVSGEIHNILLDREQKLQDGKDEYYILIPVSVDKSDVYCILEELKK